MDRKRLLVIDDQRESLEMIIVLVGDKYRILGCSSANEALQVVEEFNPDLLLVNVPMTPMSGPECLAAIRGRAGYENLPAIALTDLTRDEEKATLRATGFEAVVTKPIFNQEEFEGLIEPLLENRRSEDQRLQSRTSAA